MDSARMAGEEHRIRNSNRWENPERSKWAATRCGKDDRSLRASRTIAHCPKPEECNDSGGPAWWASSLGRQYCRTARDGAVTQITVIDAISHFEISERDLLSGVNEQESRMSTAQSGKTKSFRSLGSLSMLSSLPQPVIRDLDSKLILAKHSAGSVLYRQGDLVATHPVQQFTKACNCAATPGRCRFVIPAARSDIYTCGAGTTHRSFARDGHPVDEKIRAQRIHRYQEILISNYRPQASEANCGAKLTLLIRECPDRRAFGTTKKSARIVTA